MTQARKNKKKGSKYEDKVKKSINSGTFWFSPLDLDYGRYIIECKFTDKKGFRIPLSLVEKIWNKALSLNKEPLLSIGIRRNKKQVFVLNCTIQLDNY